MQQQESDVPAIGVGNVEPDENGHQWIVAANIPVSAAKAREGLQRACLTIGGLKVAPKGVKIDVLDAYCKRCGRPYEQVVDQECPADTSHRIGGPIGERKKRKPLPTPPPGAIIYTPPPLTGGRNYRTG